MYILGPPPRESVVVPLVDFGPLVNEQGVQVVASFPAVAEPVFLHVQVKPILYPIFNLLQSGGRELGQHDD